MSYHLHLFLCLIKNILFSEMKNVASLKFNDILPQETSEKSRIMRKYKKCNHGKLKKNSLLN